MKILNTEMPYIESALGDLQSQSEEPISLDSFTGFAVLLPASDEFLGGYDKKADATAYKWVTGSPGQAIRFPRLKRALAVAAQKEGAATIMIFESNNRYYVMEVQL